MNHLEEYIKQNKNQFEEEPENGHFERFLEKQNRRHHTRVMVRWSIAIAASVALVFAVGVHRQQDVPAPPEAVLCENADDMKMCYIDKMNTVADEIRQLTNHLEPWDRKIVLNDMQNIIEATHNGLVNELPEELAPEARHTILSDYYRKNLESMQNMVEVLKEV
jgi:hypothetical protein